MRAGTLKQVITILQPVIGLDDFGSNTLTWVDFVTTKADVRYKNGNRVNENQEIVYTYEFDFYIRNYHQVLDNMRIIWKDAKYRILSIEEDTYKQLKLIRTEKVNE